MQGILTEGKAQYDWPPCTKFRSSHFDIENIIYLFTKQANLVRRSTVLSLPSQLVFPGLSVEPLENPGESKTYLTRKSLQIFLDRFSTPNLVVFILHSKRMACKQPLLELKNRFRFSTLS
jgi:hypothetical protein